MRLMILREFSLEGKLAIVTGNGRGWGNYLAIALAEAGADIVIAAPGGKGIEETAKKVRKMGRRALAISTDIAKSSEVEEMVERAISEFGKIDILVNSPDLEFARPFLEVSDEEWDQVMNINLRSVFLCTRAVGKHMLERKTGRVINVVPGLAVRGLSNCTAYCAAKGGVLQLTKALSQEWARGNIRVNAIGHGWFSEEERSEEEQLKDPLVRYIPLRRLGRPRDLSGLVVLLASDACDYINGQVLFADGGVLAHV